MYLDDGVYFRSGRYEERRIDISGGIGDVTRKRLLEKRASNRRNRPRECLVTLFDTRPSKLHGRAAASYPPRVTINMHINTQPSYDPAADASRRLSSSKAARGALKDFPPGIAQGYSTRRGRSNHVSLSFDWRHEANIGMKINSRASWALQNYSLLQHRREKNGSRKPPCAMRNVMQTFLFPKHSRVYVQYILN